jgi:hypothetical protein
VYCFQAVKTPSFLKEYEMKVYFRASAGTLKKVHRIIESKAAEGRIECLQQLTLKDVPLIISESKGMVLIRVLEG